MGGRILIGNLAIFLRLGRVFSGGVSLNFSGAGCLFTGSCDCDCDCVMCDV